MEFEDKKRRKIQEKLDEEKDKELEGCTFKPEILTRLQERSLKRRWLKEAANQLTKDFMT